MCRRFLGGVASESTSVKGEGCRTEPWKDRTSAGVMVDPSSDPERALKLGSPSGFGLN